MTGDVLPVPAPFPTNWSTAVVMAPHPDDPEYLSAAVAKWTAAGKQVHYILASRGEAGIVGMSAEEAGPLREDEQRRAARIVGVTGVEFWTEPDSNIRDTPALRAKIADAPTNLHPDVVITVYGGSEWAPGVPNQPDHVEFAAAVEGAYDVLAEPPPWLFASALQATHVEVVDDHIGAAIASLAAHECYLRALDPSTPPGEQARRQLQRAVPVRDDIGGHRVAQFQRLRG